MDLLINQVIQGSALDVLKIFPNECVQCCITSPPYYGLRNYGIDGQIGLEKTPEEYIEKLIQIFREVKRVLKKDGTLWLNIADSYSTPKIGNTETQKNPRLVTNSFRKECPPNLKSKNLCLIPARLSIALQQNGWYVRSDIIWHKTNPMPESCTDRPTQSYEHLFLLAKSEKYYYKQLFEPYVADSDMEYRKTLRCGRKYGTKRPYKDNQPLSHSRTAELNPEGKNIRDVWTINNKSSGTEHIATFPEALVEPMILAGCPKDGIVLDPFAGTFTTGKVAIKLGRKAVGIELNPKYIQDIANWHIKEAETGVDRNELKNGQQALFLVAK